MTESTTTLSPIELATELTAAWLSNPNTRADAGDASAFLLRMKTQIGDLDASSAHAAATEVVAEPERAEGVVTARKSLASKDHILSMIDGKPYKTLRRHLATHGFTPASYRECFGLKPDYPMTAPAYSRARSEMAKSIGLGRIPKGK